MSSIESVQPSDEDKERVVEVLERLGPLSHREVVEETELGDSEVQRAINDLWREGSVYHTLDRKYDLEKEES